MVRCWTAGTAWDNSHRQTSSASQHEYPQQREESFFLYMQGLTSRFVSSLQKMQPLPEI